MSKYRSVEVLNPAAQESFIEGSKRRINPLSHHKSHPMHPILDHTQIQHIVRRIAYQIYEVNSREEAVVLAGILDNGYTFAKKIKAQLEKISPLKVVLCSVAIDKKKPLVPIETSLKPEAYAHASLVLVDDVLNSGTTLIYGVKHFLEVPLKRFNTAVLVDRSHKKFPVKSDFKGISLSTSLNENVQVIFEKNKDRALLG